MVNQLSKRIKELREKKNLSQELVARKLGISRPTYIQIEKGEREITVNEAKKLSSIFGLKPEVFLFEKHSPNIKVSLEKEEKEKESDIRISVPQKNVSKFFLEGRICSA